MATLILSAAGQAVGASIGGSFLGFSAAAIGQTVGAVAGAVIDQRLLGSGSRAVETGRAGALRLQTSTPGAPMARVFGRMRVAGEIIWSTRFLETTRTTTQGGKALGGGQTVRQFSYSISLAVGLCAGRIDRIGRIWADGKLLDLTDLAIRVYPGDEDQLPDPKIEAVEGPEHAPAFRGTAYVVFEDLALAQFGNRIPQLNIEVFRSVNRPAEGPEAGTPLPALIRGVALSPGTGEFALEPEEARHVYEGGVTVAANVNNPEGRPDILVALDQLEAEAPAARAVSLVVSWFGSDLRCGQCRVEPKVEARNRSASPEPWRVAGLTAETAPLVSQDAEGRPVFGGTPSDGSVVRAIREMSARGLAVMLYPFLLMDIPAGNALPDPYGRPEQPAFPWRGRITLAAAPGEPGSADQSAAAAAEVDAFFGTVTAADFTVDADAGTVAYAGPEEWSWSRCALHMAALAAAAGGVEAICIGSEMRGLSTIRSGKTSYPAVARLIALAAEVRALLPDAKISYAADWSEYFGHQPGDGSGDRIFHLDPLWADANIDFVGIDDYLPLSDWRHEAGHLDGQDHPAIYSLPYLLGNVEGGEHYDFYYASEADRAAQLRSPIDDTAHGEHWVFRPKDIRGWWANPHHDRIDGVRQPAPTAWVPGSKPVWLTETGCPAVDLGANMPNLFHDPKSSESGLPPGSAGARDDEMQRRYLQAKLGYWSDPANNPPGMIDPARIFVWTWDARPFPDFPAREGVWSDGPAHATGHWITGRVGNGALADVVHEISVDAGLAPAEIDVSRLHDAVQGYLIEETGSARAALQPLMLAYGVDAHESGGRIVYTMRGQAAAAPLDPARLVASDEALGAAVRARESAGTTPDTVRLSYVEAESDYRLAAAEARAPGAGAGPDERVAQNSLALAFPSSRAQRIADRWLAEGLIGRDRVSLALPPSGAALEPGDLIRLPGPGRDETYRIERIAEGGERALEAVRVERAAYSPAAVAERRSEIVLSPPPGPISAAILELPLADGGADHAPHLAVWADPWPGAAAVYRAGAAGEFALIAEPRVPAFAGALLAPLPPGDPGLWQRAAVEVALPGGSLLSRARLAVLGGANRLALEAAPGQWEILQAREAVLTGTNRMRLSGLLRGRRGTEALAAAEIAPGARLLVLDEGVARLPLDPEARGLPLRYRIGPADRPVSDPAFVELEHAGAALGLRPFAPVHLEARRLPGGDLAISWTRRSRLGGDVWEAPEIPLGEAAEGYRLRILMGGAELRAIDTAAPSATYTAAQQAADGAAGSIELRVAQLSATYGHGLEEGITTDV
ncbi:glycoside hydrolase TIM-barrel-like domain-containing protein [Paralimibaculum aggregatum]|uniref:Glycoside hydrolase TIM-barrel-like domain-containing protein n=1 Tax=Paralimibaculum aggregatum TaxID=3036245 RepID=A0ABQ6LCZ7_9RHOB|nr:glycoside hydrolase/phage tail family protein [Limibaculum sp. NKW23]GMG81241.1 glycoside hydrolase TIM-barrel-like domain-containing protein [Limibaculum sp. NKW23]